MIRTSKHNISKITNQNKLNYLDKLFVDYKLCLEHYINLIINDKLGLKKNLSSKNIPDYNITHSRYKQLIYKHASEIIRSQIKKSNDNRYYKYKIIYKYFKNNNRQTKFTNKKYSELKLKRVYLTKYFTKPNLNNISINLDYRFFDIKIGGHFDNFIKIILPYFNEKRTRALQIKIPLKQHKHSNNLIEMGFKLKNNIQIKHTKQQYYVNLIYEKEFIKNNNNKSIGIDLGVNKMIVSSDGQYIGENLKKIYKKIRTKKRNSKNYYKLLTYRNNLTNYYCNQLDLKDISTLFIENLKNVKKNKSFNKTIKSNKKPIFKKNKQNEINDINSRWLYPVIISKIERICEDNGILLVKVSPAYTSQTCSKCGEIHRESRKGELFNCISCGCEIDSDYNASINIYNKGVYSLHSQERE